MSKEVLARPKARSRTVATAVGAALLLVLFISGLAFANSVGAAKVAENARSLHWANATLGTASLARAAAVQAITFAQLESEGLAQHDDVVFAMAQVEASYQELRDLEGVGGAGASVAELTHFLAPLDSAVAMIHEGDHEAAQTVIFGDAEIAYLNLVDSLQLEQDAIQRAIDENTATASRLNGFVLFLLTLALPASAVAVYWRIARRQVKQHRVFAELELESERSVSRAKDSFIAGLSHELRTPLTSIYGFAEILADGGGDDPRQTEEIARIIANESAEMTRMVDDLLTASRMESTGIEIESVATRLQDIVESAITPFERAGLEIKRDPTDVVVKTDGARLRQVLVNLLSNAARHGGPKIGIEVSATDDDVDIEVWDTGPGVPEDQIAKLFERFMHKGAAPLLAGSVGLGLAVASRLTAMLGGKLSYQRFGAKSYFVVRVPAVVKADEVDEASPSVAEAIRAMSA